MITILAYMKYDKFHNQHVWRVATLGQWRYIAMLYWFKGTKVAPIYDYIKDLCGRQRDILGQTRLISCRMMSCRRQKQETCDLFY